MKRTRRHFHRRKKANPLTKERIFEMSKNNDIYICLDETVWDEDMNTGNNSFEQRWQKYC